MRFLARLATISIVVVISGCAQLPDAIAGTFGQWRFRGSVICVEYPATSGEWPVLAAARAWDKSQKLRVTAGPSCAMYPATQRVIVKTYSSDEYACAKTDPGLLYSS